MGYNHKMVVVARVKPGTTVQQVSDAVNPILDYKGYDAEVFTNADAAYGDDVFFYDPDTCQLEIVTYGEVGYMYNDIVKEVASRLGTIVAEPGEIWLYDYDTCDEDDFKTVFVYGPSDDAVNAYIAKRDIEKAMRLLEAHLPTELIDRIKEVIAAKE